MGAMRKLTGAAVAVAVLTASAAITAAVASAAPGSDDYVVTFVDGADPDTIAHELAMQGKKVSKIYRKVMAGLSVKLTDIEAQSLSNSPVVEHIELDIPFEASDVRSPATWGIDRSDQRALPLNGTYSYPTSAGAGTYVYVLDTGVRATHSELAGRVAPGFDGVNDGNGTNDCNGHGTHVSGTVAGKTYGMASRATVVPVRVLDCTGSGSLSSVLAGLDYVVNDTTRRPAVVNMSLGGGANSTIDDAVNKVINGGVTVVNAAGNSNVDACTLSPGRVPAVVTVGAVTNSNDTRASYSNWGTCLDLFAPGSSITSSWITDDNATNTISGTSMASPHVAGAAAVLLGETPTLTPAQVATGLVSAATTGVVQSAGTGSPNRLLYADPTLMAPANDPFTKAATLSVSGSGSVSGTSLNGSKEPGEPNHAGNAGGASVWYQFTPSTTAPVTLTTAGSGFDTLLSVYTGTSVDALTMIGANDNSLTTAPVSAAYTVSSVAFRANAGTTYRVAVDGVDGAKGPVTLTWSVATPVAVATTTLAGASGGLPYSAQLVASGGTGMNTWSLAGGSLPSGLTLSPSGAITGTPPSTTSTVTSTFTVSVTDGFSTASKQLSIAVAPPVTITTTSVPGGTLNVTYSATLAATGGTGTYTWSLASGSLPSGVTLATTGVLSGKPTVGGSFAFSARATDGDGRTAIVALTLAVASPLSIVTSALPAATVKVAYSAQLVSSGGTGTTTWRLAAGTLPAGLSLTSSGVVSGTPTVTGTFSFTVGATSGTASVTKAVSLSIGTAVVVSTSSLASGKAGTAYSATLAATGGSGGYTWSLAGGTLPTGLALSTTGVISGNPTVAATSTFTVAARDSAGRVGTKSLSITIAAGTVSLAGQFNKLTPASGATGVSRTSIALSWTSSSGATSYQICISTRSGSCTTWTSVGNATSATVTVSLASKTIYYWQVRAVNAAGVTNANSGTWFKFTTAI